MRAVTTRIPECLCWVFTQRKPKSHTLSRPPIPQHLNIYLSQIWLHVKKNTAQPRWWISNVSAYMPFTEETPPPGNVSGKKETKTFNLCQLYVHIFVCISERTKYFCDSLEVVMEKWVSSGLGDTLFKDSPSTRDDSFLNQSAKSYTQKLTLDQNFHLERLYK